MYFRNQGLFFRRYPGLKQYKSEIDYEVHMSVIHDVDVLYDDVFMSYGLYPEHGRLVGLSMLTVESMISDQLVPGIVESFLVEYRAKPSLIAHLREYGTLDVHTLVNEYVENIQLKNHVKIAMTRLLDDYTDHIIQCLCQQALNAIDHAEDPVIQAQNESIRYQIMQSISISKLSSACLGDFEAFVK